MTPVEINPSVLQDRSLLPGARILYAAIAKNATATEGCRLTHAGLADAAGMERRSVIRHLKRLEAAGLLRIEKVTGTFNVYWPLAPAETEPAV